MTGNHFYGVIILGIFFFSIQALKKIHYAIDLNKTIKKSRVLVCPYP